MYDGIASTEREAAMGKSPPPIIQCVRDIALRHRVIFEIGPCTLDTLCDGLGAGGRKGQQVNIAASSYDVV